MRWQRASVARRSLLSTGSHSGAPTGSIRLSVGSPPAAGSRRRMKVGKHAAMTKIASQLDVRSDAFRTNAERTKSLVADLQDKVATVKLGGGERARERHLSRGKLLPRQGAYSARSRRPLPGVQPTRRAWHVRRRYSGGGSDHRDRPYRRANAWSCAMTRRSRTAPTIR